MPQASCMGPGLRAETVRLPSHGLHPGLPSIDFMTKAKTSFLLPPPRRRHFSLCFVPLAVRGVVAWTSIFFLPFSVHYYYYYCYTMARHRFLLTPSTPPNVCSHTHVSIGVFVRRWVQDLTGLPCWHASHWAFLQTGRSERMSLKGK